MLEPGLSNRDEKKNLGRKGGPTTQLRVREQRRLYGWPLRIDRPQLWAKEQGGAIS